MKRNIRKTNVVIDQETVIVRARMRNEKNAVVHVINVNLKKTEIEIENVKDLDQKRSEEIQDLEIMRRKNVQKIVIVMRNVETEIVIETEKERERRNVNEKKREKYVKKKRRKNVKEKEKKSAKRSAAVHQTDGKI